MRPAHEIALFGGSGGVTRDCAERVDLAEMDIDSESVLQRDRGVS